MERWAEYRYYPSQSLTLTLVVFEFRISRVAELIRMCLTLTLVVFEFSPFVVS